LAGLVRDLDVDDDDVDVVDVVDVVDDDDVDDDDVDVDDDDVDVDDDDDDVDVDDVDVAVAVAVARRLAGGSSSIEASERLPSSGRGVTRACCALLYASLSTDDAGA